jgi:hypothetical protein
MIFKAAGSIGKKDKRDDVMFNHELGSERTTLFDMIRSGDFGKVLFKYFSTLLKTRNG